MPKVKDARKLECRQAYWHMNAPDGSHHWHFPKCSASSCAHWRHLQSREHKTFSKFELAKERNLDSAEDVLPEEWDNYVDGLIADGWKSGRYGGIVKVCDPNNSEVVHYSHQINLYRELDPEDQTGECGLIMPDSLEVNT
jgi:hypothetical protein